MLSASGYHLDETSRILDFGCGEGGDVYAWRDAGFDARGFDIHDRVKLRSDEDRRFFGFMEASTSDTSDHSVDRDRFQIPFEAETFDFVFSGSVLEHVQNLERSLAEAARVMKRTSVAFHVFPPRYVLIEPHMHVPFGSLFRSYRYFHLWAGLGIRNEWQQGQSAAEVAASNTRYAKTGINYPPPWEILRMAKRHYTRAEFVPELLEGIDGSRLRRLQMTSTWGKRLYSCCKWIVLRLEKE
jgi:SAM-dependent methyltransferase